MNFWFRTLQGNTISTLIFLSKFSNCKLLFIMRPQSEFSHATDGQFLKIFKIQQVLPYLTEFKSQNLYDEPTFNQIIQHYNLMYEKTLNKGDPDEPCGQLIHDLIYCHRFGHLLSEFKNEIKVHINKIKCFYPNIAQREFLDSIYQNLNTAIRYLNSQDYLKDFEVLSNLAHRIDEFQNILNNRIIQVQKALPPDQQLDKFAVEFLRSVRNNLISLSSVLRLTDKIRTVQSLLISG